MARMQIVERFYWRCAACGAEHDDRDSRDSEGRVRVDSPGIIAALWWALDMLDMYDKELLRRGDPPEKVNSPTHLEAKAKARSALDRALAASVPEGTK